MSHQKIPPDREGNDRRQKPSNVGMVGRERLSPVIPIGWKQPQCDRREMLLQVEDPDGSGQSELLHDDSGANTIRGVEEDSAYEYLSDEQNDDCVRVGRYVHGAESCEERCRGSSWPPPNAQHLVADRPDHCGSQEAMQE